MSKAFDPRSDYVVAENKALKRAVAQSVPGIKLWRVAFSVATHHKKKFGVVADVWQ